MLLYDLSVKSDDVTMSGNCTIKLYKFYCPIQNEQAEQA